MQSLAISAQIASPTWLPPDWFGWSPSEVSPFTQTGRKSTQWQRTLVASAQTTSIFGNRMFEVSLQGDVRAGWVSRLRHARISTVTTSAVVLGASASRKSSRHPDRLARIPMSSDLWDQYGESVSITSSFSMKSVARITAASAARPDRDKCPPCRRRHGRPFLCLLDETACASVNACARASTLLGVPIHPGSTSRRRTDERAAKDRGRPDTSCDGMPRFRLGLRRRTRPFSRSHGGSRRFKSCNAHSEAQEILGQIPGMGAARSS